MDNQGSSNPRLKKLSIWFAFISLLFKQYFVS